MLTRYMSLNKFLGLVSVFALGVKKAIGYICNTPTRFMMVHLQYDGTKMK